MWGDAAPARASAGKKDSLSVTSSVPADDGEEALFADKARRFDAADASFRALVDSLAAYKTAVLRAAECGVTVATNMDKFFGSRDNDQKQLVSKFLDAQISIRAKWLSDSEKSFDAEVLAPIKSRLDEIPKVRDYIKQRSAALAEMQKRQKKLQSERKRDGSRLRDKQRRLKEISDRYAMFHDEVIQRFNYIERNMGSFVTAPLRSLVAVMAEQAKASVDTLDDVVKLVEETPPITKELSPAAPMTSLTDIAGGVVDRETWDDSYAFEDDDDDDDDEHEHDADDVDSETASARASSRRPPRDGGRGRVRSADTVAKGPASSLSGLEGNFGLDLSLATSPRRGRSTSSTPADGTTVYSPTYSLPLASSVSGGMQRESATPSGSVVGRGPHVGQEPYYLPSMGTSAASSTSTTENVSPDACIRGSTSQQDSFQRRRRRDEKGSRDTVSSGENIVRNEVLMRLVAIYDFVPQESNELEIHIGDVIEVSAKNDSGWWCGRRGKSTGYFPRNYTRQLTEQEELEYLSERRRRKRRGHRRQESHESRRSGHTASQSSLAVL